MPEDLTFVINPEAQAASIDLFFKAIQDIRRLLRDVDYAVHGGAATRRWIISGLHSSAPAVSVRPVLGDQESVDVVARGIRTITAGTDQPPEYFTEQALEDLRRMRRLFTGRDRARSIVVSINSAQTAMIEQDISEKASRILTSGYWHLFKRIPKRVTDGNRLTSSWSRSKLVHLVMWTYLCGRPRGHLGKLTWATLGHTWAS